MASSGLRVLMLLLTSMVGSLLVLSGSAPASIISTTGAVAEASPPANLSTGAWESNTVVRAFSERQNLALSQPVNLDITLPGTSPNATDSNLSAGAIPAGATVSVYALHFDVVGAPPVSGAIELTGSITVDENILGLIVLSDSLTATNGILGIPGSTYPFGAQYGLELNPAGGGTSDVVTMSADRRTVTIRWRDASSADNLRIVTAVPEPYEGTLGAVFSAHLLRRKRRRTGHRRQRP